MTSGKGWQAKSTSSYNNPSKDQKWVSKDKTEQKWVSKDKTEQKWVSKDKTEQKWVAKEQSAPEESKIKEPEEMVFKEKMQEEIEVLQAIYGEEFCVLEENEWKFCLSIGRSEQIYLRCHLPYDYPESAPFAEMDPPLCVFEALNLQWTPQQSIYDWVLAIQELLAEGQFSDNESCYSSEPGEDTLLQEDEEYNEAAAQAAIEEARAASRAKRDVMLQSVSETKLSAKDKAKLSAGLPTIHHGALLTQKKSTFQAHLAVIQSMDEAAAVYSKILEDGRVARAHHNQFAYKCEDKNGVVYADNYDDGEDGAGTKLAELISNMGACNVFVCVSRWYGGVLMGPSRFKCIAKVAADLMRDQGLAKK